MRKPKRSTFIAALLALAVLAAALPGCTSMGYYWQSTKGHLALLNAAKPVADWIDDASTPAAVRERLQWAAQIRDFASRELSLPDNASYRRYADLKRSAVVWNVVAAPADSLQLKTWCFVVVGCVGYRGYFSPEQAQQEAKRLQALGYEVNVYGVMAYSTLGYLNWLGGDPLLSTFIHVPQGELARIIFHELAHQVLYVTDDTAFNESFATAVERLGGQIWLERHASAAARQEYATFERKRREFRALTLRTRQQLERLYARHRLAPPDPAALALSAQLTHDKAQIMQNLRDEYAQWKAAWGGFSAYDRFIAQANNASLGAQAAYDELVPEFEAVFERRQRQWPAFFSAIQSIAALPAQQRRQALRDLTQ